MKRISFLLFWLVGTVLTAHAQETPTPLDRSKTEVDPHVHSEACFTVHLLESEEGKQAIREFRAWSAAGRPDVRGKSPVQDFRTLAVGDKRNFRVLDFNNNAEEADKEIEIYNFDTELT